MQDILHTRLVPFPIYSWTLTQNFIRSSEFDQKLLAWYTYNMIISWTYYYSLMKYSVMRNVISLFPSAQHKRWPLPQVSAEVCCLSVITCSKILLLLWENEAHKTKAVQVEFPIFWCRKLLPTFSFPLFILWKSHSPMKVKAKSSLIAWNTFLQ
jgi:hypothetical protein